MADVVVVEELHPGVGLGAIDRAIATGPYSAPLGYKQRYAVLQRGAARLRSCSLWEAA